MLTWKDTSWLTLNNAVNFPNLSNWKEEAWKNQGFNGIRTRDLRDTGAMLYQLSYEATHWERGQFIEFISPVRSKGEYSVVPSGSGLRQCMMDKVHASHLFRGTPGEPKKPSTGQTSTRKSQSSFQGAAFATATKQSNRKNRRYVARYL